MITEEEIQSAIIKYILNFQNRTHTSDIQTLFFRLSSGLDNLEAAAIEYGYVDKSKACNIGGFVEYELTPYAIEKLGFLLI